MKWKNRQQKRVSSLLRKGVATPPIRYRFMLWKTQHRKTRFRRRNRKWQNHKEVLKSAFRKRKYSMSSKEKKIYALDEKGERISLIDPAPDFKSRIERA